MNWTAISSVLALATVKFLLAPSSGRALSLPFWETYFAALIGGVLSATFFYFFSGFLMRISEKRKAKKLASNQPIKRKSSKSKRLILKIKNKFGMYGICILGPFILSIPIGTIIAAKMYGKSKMTYPIILFGLALNGMILTVISYLI
jgi:hypothetical protein